MLLQRRKLLGVQSLIPSVHHMYPDINIQVSRSCQHTVTQIQEARADHGSDISAGYTGGEALFPKKHK